MSTPDAEFTSDRTLLLQEIKSLAKEVARLRGDTRGLVHEEILRSRRKNALIGLLAFTLLAVPLFGFFIHQQQINNNRATFIQRTVAVCEERNQDTQAMGTFLQRLAAAPRRPGAPPPTEESLRAYEEFQKSLAPVDCQKLIKDD